MNIARRLGVQDSWPLNRLLLRTSGHTKNAEQQEKCDNGTQNHVLETPIFAFGCGTPCFQSFSKPALESLGVSAISSRGDDSGFGSH
jgi:coenzyme F420-reducing hydrogenase gamma subunit